MAETLCNENMLCGDDKAPLALRMCRAGNDKALRSIENEPVATRKGLVADDFAPSKQ